MENLTFYITMIDTILLHDLKDLGADGFFSFPMFGIASPAEVVGARADPVKNYRYAAVASVDPITVPGDCLLFRLLGCFGSEVSCSFRHD